MPLPRRRPSRWRVRAAVRLHTAGARSARGRRSAYARQAARTRSATGEARLLLFAPHFLAAARADTID